MLLNDVEITRLAGLGMISPFIPELIRENENGQKIISAGLSSFGYDLRADSTVQIFKPRETMHDVYYHPDSYTVNPKNITPDHMQTLEIRSDAYGRFVVIPAHTFALCHSIETINLPPSITAVVCGKSSYERSGLKVSTTVAEAGWIGQLVIELQNCLSCPIRFYVQEGACQLLFYQGVNRASISYADRNGKYMYQTGITLPIA